MECNIAKLVKRRLLKVHIKYIKFYKCNLTILSKLQDKMLYTLNFSRIYISLYYKCYNIYECKIRTNIVYTCLHLLRNACIFLRGK